MSKISKKRVNRAGDLLIGKIAESDDFTESDAREVVNEWRALHALPLAAFQATLRKRVNANDFKRALIAHRLKRAPSILAKLERFERMRLARMQDIGGLRVVLKNVNEVRRLQKIYRKRRLIHQEVKTDDYLLKPKEDGYRSLHLTYRYKDNRHPAFDGLLLELQIRSQPQHAWATAVETVDVITRQALKLGSGQDEWKDFFATASAALGIEEKTPVLEAFADFTEEEILLRVERLAGSLRVIERLSAWTVAVSASEEEPSGDYQLIVLHLSSDPKKVRREIHQFKKEELGQASAAYLEAESMASENGGVDAVLVSAGPLRELRRAYPNYFLDSTLFLKRLEKWIARAKKLRGEG